MTITFRTVSPMVNTTTVFVLFSTLGWELTLACVRGGLTFGIIGGSRLKQVRTVRGRLRLRS
ncbi:hypothetical protein KGY64_05710 [Candidatus Bipolaricaulota bacterium]|nr:hypothetical protein [Candidatus Bipolaricaulota bacterium]